MSTSPHARIATSVQGTGGVNCPPSAPDLTPDLASRIEQALGIFTERLHGLEKRFDDEGELREQTLASMAEKKKNPPPGFEPGTGGSEASSDTATSEYQMGKNGRLAPPILDRFGARAKGRNRQPPAQRGDRPYRAVGFASVDEGSSTHPTDSSYPPRAAAIARGWRRGSGYVAKESDGESGSESMSSDAGPPTDLFVPDDADNPHARAPIEGVATYGKPSRYDMYGNKTADKLSSRPNGSLLKAYKTTEPSLRFLFNIKSYLASILQTVGRDEHVYEPLAAVLASTTGVYDIHAQPLCGHDPLACALWRFHGRAPEKQTALHRGDHRGRGLHAGIPRLHGQVPWPRLRAQVCEGVAD